MTWTRRALAALLAVLIAPRAALACPVCFGQSDSPLAIAMNTGILFMLGVIVAVLGCFGAREWQLHSVTAALRKKDTLERGHGDDRFRHRLRICEKRAEDAGLSRERPLQTNNCRKEAVRVRPRCLSSEPDSVNP